MNQTNMTNPNGSHVRSDNSSRMGHRHSRSQDGSMADDASVGRGNGQDNDEGEDQKFHFVVG